MDGLLAKDAARRSADFQDAWPLPDAEPQAGPASLAGAEALSSAPLGKVNRKATKAAAKAAAKTDNRKTAKAAAKAGGAQANGTAPPTQPSGIIVPSDGRRSRSGRAGRRSAKILIGLVIAALIGAGGAVYWKQTHKSTAATNAGPVASPSPQAAAPALSSLILASVPGAFTRQADTVGDTGPSNLAKAVSDDGNPGAQAALVQDGFVQGYQRLWSSTDGKQGVVVFLYQFKTSTGATAYGQRMVDAAKATAKPAPTAFSVPGLPAATGLSGSASGNHTAEVTVTKGTYLVGITAQGPVAATVVHEAQLVATSQYAALPASQ